MRIEVGSQHTPLAGVCAGGEELLQHREVTMLGRKVKRRPPLGDGVLARIGPSRQQHFHNLNTGDKTREGQRERMTQGKKSTNHSTN
jgi:hypothetical protein